MVRAYGSDDVQHVHDTASGVAVVRIGRLTWPLHDQAAWATATATWRQVADIALWSWPRSTPAPRHPPRHRTRRGASTLPSMTWKELSGTDGLITGVASGRRVMWIVRLPAGRVVRGDVTINAATANRPAAVADHLAYVRSVLLDGHEASTDSASLTEGV